MFSHVYMYRGLIVTFLAWRYNSLETTGNPSSKYEHRRQTALLLNIRNIRICTGKKPVVSVTYKNKRISMKNSLPYLKCVLRGPRADLWPFYGFFVDRFLSRGPHRRDVTHILSKVSCFLLKFFYFRRLQRR